jgi:hypothetical protein
LSNTIVCLSQIADIECATPNSIDPDPPGVYSYSSDPIVYQNGEPLVLNIFYWQVKGPNGDYGNHEFTEEKVLESVALLNIQYNPYNIFFKYRGYDCFETPANLPSKNYVWDNVLQEYVCETVSGAVDPDGYGIVDRCQIQDFWVYSFLNGYKHNDAINIYVPYGTIGFGGVAIDHGSNKTILPISKINTLTAYHEIAHNFGIYHTRSADEHTTRDPFLPNGDPNLEFNALKAGDMLVESAANSGYLFFDANGQPYYPYIDANCNYQPGFETDETGEPYEIFPEDIINNMTDAYECITNSFFPSQIIRMRETIVSDNNLIPTITDVASLYEPYRGAYNLENPTAPDGVPLFQPGFDYSFIACSCESIDVSCDFPIPYHDTSFQNNHTVISSFDKYYTPYTNITHPNHTAIWIAQLDDPKTRRCWDNWNTDAHNGTVIKFNDNVFNANVTITPKDSLQINDQNLILNLPEGLYKIEKNYIDGSSQETVIIKEN